MSTDDNAHRPLRIPVHEEKTPWSTRPAHAPAQLRYSASTSVAYAASIAFRFSFSDGVSSPWSSLN
ncbi:hypothetical protein GCM10017688_00990 [Streptomyces ramulosus]